MLKKTNAVPSRKATAAICANVARSKASVATRLPIAAIRTTSAESISNRRFHRSAATPARSAKSAYGAKLANPTMPARPGECVSARTSSGYAICVACVPAVEKS